MVEDVERHAEWATFERMMDVTTESRPSLLPNE